MPTNKYFPPIFAAILLALTSCGNKTAASDADTDTTAVDSTLCDVTNAEALPVSANYTDSTALYIVKINVDVQLPSDCNTPAVGDNIIAAIIAQMDGEAVGLANAESRPFKPYGHTAAATTDAKTVDVQPVVATTKYYGTMLSRHFSQESSSLNKERKASIEEARTEAEANGEDVSSIPDFKPVQLVAELRVTKYYENSKYLVLGYATYGYWGGAHGGAGSVNITLDKSTGKQVKDFFRKGSEKKMQALLRRGLKQYFCQYGEKITTDAQLFDCLLLGDDRVIPLPSTPPSPSAYGFLFTYQQYEIAPYAAGQPSFVIPYKDLKPYLLLEIEEES